MKNATNYSDHMKQVQQVYAKPPKENRILRGMLRRTPNELVVIQLAGWAAYHGDRLSKADLERLLLAIRRMEGLSEAINARL